jgi:serine/threonine protein phosphatase PrpC
MGSYLSQPVTDKETHEGESDSFAYGVVAMQGWRRTMEDAHTVSICEEHGLFGVFDGHGGR